MSYSKDIVILTKSAKNHGYCVAGIDINSGEWVRIVGYNNGPLYPNDMISSNNRSCEPLDVVRVTFLGHTPYGCQTENEEMDPYTKWKYIKSMSLSEVLQIHPEDNMSFIFGNIFYGLTEEDKDSLDYSLTMISVTNLSFYTSNNRKTKARFLYNGRIYRDICVTDEDFFNCEESFPHAYLVLSIPNDKPTNYKYFYKFLAKAFVKKA